MLLTHSIGKIGKLTQLSYQNQELLSFFI